jgi:2-polyprenyl-6-methoxyphenol hydroxylase-like FAD-dependent oxidoreductase
MMDTQVLIAGGGPVGLGLAIELGQRGISCVLVERHLQPQPIPRGQNLTQRTMEHMYFWGTEPAIRAARTIPPEYGIGGLTAYGALLGEYSYDWLQRELVRPFYFTDNERLPQYATEAVLRERVAALPAVTTLFGRRVERITQDADGVTAVLAGTDGAAPQTVRAAYAAGCDGARSVVREQAGLTQTRSDHDKLMVLLVFRSTELHTLLARYKGKSFYNVLTPELQGYWQFFGRVDLGTTWFFHAPVPMGTTRDNYDFAALLHKAVGAPFALELEHIGFWDLRFAVADSYRNGRLFIAGDSAHSHPPYGGYGINTGFEDARNLGWKLAACLQGWGGANLLDSYSRERQPVFASTATDFIEKSIHDDRDFLAAFDPAIDRAAFEARWNLRRTGAASEVGAFEPHYEGSPIIAGPTGGQSSAVGRHSALARPGHHLTPQPLSTGQNVYQALGPDLTLVALDAAPGAAVFRAAAEQLKLKLTILTDTREGGREAWGAPLVLVRPDQFVAWTADSAPADAQAVLRTVTGQ